MEFTINDFNGPLDLLLHLIKESKMDIFSIKLEIIIDEYLNFINEMKNKNLDIASSYLVMSCELLEIKSRMLLPKNEDEEEDEEDPKERLINRLIIYEQYKEAVDDFKDLESKRNTYYTKLPTSISELDVQLDTPILNDLTVDDLKEAFLKMLDRIEMEKPVNTKVTKKELSVEDEIKTIKNKLSINKKMSFFDLFEVKTKEYIVVTFLAILEMAKKKELRIIQEKIEDDIKVEAI